ncbi:helix-turn-helix domain-containing protein, partial [Streptosporangium sp. NPDC051023]|uniref:helix-turn-helix domain-containing protein n=1 Tax=Streptosporangium sp. NPDC051023 TaxID=3155410 RepID=UPI00344C60AA
MNDVLRLTGATLDVLEALAAADGQTVYGLQLADATRRPTGTIYPLLARLEERGWLEGGWESGDDTRRRGPRRRYYRVTGDGREHIAAALRRRERKIPPPPRTATRPDRLEHPPGAGVGAEQVVGEFVHELRTLRERAGGPSLRQLAARTYYSPAALSEAFAGRTLPSEKLLEAIVSACAGDSHEWALRRSLAEQSIRYGIRIPYRFQDFYPLGVRWVQAALRPQGLQRTDIEDIAQETLLAAYQRWRSVIPNLRQWIPQQARRMALSLPRRARQAWHLDGTYVPALDLDLSVSPPPPGNPRQGDVADAVVARMSADHLLRGMDRRTAQVVYLTSHGFTTAEIAERLAMTTVAVEGRRRRVRTRLRLDGAPPITAEHAAYLRHLRRLREEAGNPPLREIAGRVGYSHTHVAAVLAGAVSLPGWEFTARIVRSLGGEARTARRLWEEARPHRTPEKPDDHANVTEPDSPADVAARIGDTMTLWKLADHLEQAGKTAEAVRVWRTAAEAGDTYAMAMTAELLVRLGDRDEAETWLRRAVDAGDAEAWQGLIRLLEQTGRTEEAIEIWRHAATTGDLSATRKLTRLLQQAGRTEEAINAWHRAADAGDVEARQELTRLLEQTGRTEEAIEIWRHAATTGDLSATRKL